MIDVVFSSLFTLLAAAAASDSDASSCLSDGSSSACSLAPQEVDEIIRKLSHEDPQGRNPYCTPTGEWGFQMDDGRHFKVRLDEHSKTKENIAYVISEKGEVIQLNRNTGEVKFVPFNQLNQLSKSALDAEVIDPFEAVNFEAEGKNLRLSPQSPSFMGPVKEESLNLEDLFESAEAKLLRGKEESSPTSEPEAAAPLRLGGTEAASAPGVNLGASMPRYLPLSETPSVSGTDPLFVLDTALQKVLKYAPEDSESMEIVEGSPLDRHRGMIASDGSFAVALAPTGEARYWGSPQSLSLEAYQKEKADLNTNAIADSADSRNSNSKILGETLRDRSVLKLADALKDRARNAEQAKGSAREGKDVRLKALSDKLLTKLPWTASKSQSKDSALVAEAETQLDRVTQKAAERFLRKNQKWLSSSDSSVRDVSRLSAIDDVEAERLSKRSTRSAMNTHEREADRRSKRASKVPSSGFDISFLDFVFILPERWRLRF